MTNLFHQAAKRVAGNVYVRALDAGDMDAAMHAWLRPVGLISLRSAEEILAMEVRMGVR